MSALAILDGTTPAGGMGCGACGALQLIHDAVRFEKISCELAWVPGISACTASEA